MIFDQFITQFHSEQPIMPIIIDEKGCLELITSISKVHVSGFDECKTWEIEYVSLYEIPEEKKLFDILTVRNFLRDASLVPYHGKHIYILKDIDTGTPEAMNALLKVLEDCPIYAWIILVVTNPEALIGTIHSRTINLYHSVSKPTLSEEMRESLDLYRQWDGSSLARLLFPGKLEKWEAIGILEYIIKYCDGGIVDDAEQWIIDIRMSHESPRNILDSILFIPR